MFGCCDSYNVQSRPQAPSPNLFNVAQEKRGGGGGGGGEA